MSKVDSSSSALIKPEHCSCLNRLPERPSNNTWTFLALFGGPFAGVLLKYRCIFRSAVSVHNSCPSYWRWLIFLPHFFDVMFEVGTDTRVSVQESSTSHIQVAVYLTPTFAVFISSQSAFKKKQVCIILNVNCSVCTWIHFVSSWRKVSRDVCCYCVCPGGGGGGGALGECSEL